MKKIKKEKVVIFLIILLQLIVTAYFVSTKKSLFMDETASYQIANNSYDGCTDITWEQNVWKDKNEFLKHIVPQGI